MKPHKIQAVIGMGYGDEGKGLITDYYAYKYKDSNAVVIRYNGGAQAGHTVTYNKFRHIFSHLGSGTWAGVDTHLSRFFVCNPPLFRKELKALPTVEDQLSKKLRKVTVSPQCYVTTPYDMWLNQEGEALKGNYRNGSCGVGFGETIDRSTNGGYPLCIMVTDLENEEVLRKTLSKIRNGWFKIRAKTIGIKEIPPEFIMDKWDENFLADVKYFLEHISLEEDHIVLTDHETLIFEGAQGLELDQDYGVYPYVTWSNTGLKNILQLTRNCYNEILEYPPMNVTYVTRAYKTRHGNGPLPHEGEKNFKFEDKTNVENKWQGKLRFASLDIVNAAKAIRHDLGYLVGSERKATVDIAVTCTDQVEGIFYKEYDNIMSARTPEAYGREILARLRVLDIESPILVSNGPTRLNVNEVVF